MCSHLEPNGIRLLVIHAVAAVVVLIGLFLTVHNRDVESASFERDFVETRVFQDRWNDLSDFWANEGWWANGGLWSLNSDRNFNAWARQGTLEHWSVEGTLDMDGRYFYRSNSAIALLPLHVVRQAKSLVTGSPGGRRLLVLHSQLIMAGLALLLGLTATRATRTLGLSLTHAIVLGLGVQLVLQTHPLLLMSYFRLYFEHFFLLFGACVLLATTMRGERGGDVLRFIGVLGMVLADLPLAVLTLIAWALLNLIGGRTWFRQERWVRRVLLPAGIGVCVIALQYTIVALFQSDASFLGSSLFFRTGLDGDAVRYGTMWEGIFRFMRDGVFYGPHRAVAGATPVFWIAGFIAVGATLAAGAVRDRFGPMARLIALAATLVFPFIVLFSNAVYIHPFAYPMLLLPAVVLALLAVVPAVLVSICRVAWPVVLCAAVLAVSLTMANLRQFAVAFPIDTTSMSVQVPVLTPGELLTSPPHVEPSP